MDLLTIVIIGVILWLFTGVAEQVYKLTRHHKRAQMAGRLANALASLEHTHHGYHKGVGPCVCRAHREAKLCLTAWRNWNK